MSEDVYARLREFLDRLPGGFPATPAGVEIRILKKLFSPEDAEIAVHLKREPEDPAVIAQRIHMDPAEAAEKLEQMAGRGLIYRIREDGLVRYNAFHFLSGIYDFQINSIDRELAELIEEFMPFLGAFMFKLKTSQWRVLPVDSAVDGLTTVASYDKVRELIKSHDDAGVISLAHCICRLEQATLGNTCSRPLEVCLQFGDFAQYYIDNGIARKINLDEAIDVINLAEASSLVLSPSNAKKMEWLCCCCSCCCGVLTGLRMSPNPASYVRSSYQAMIHAESCSACGACMEKCQMDAIKTNNEVMEVDPTRCIGCGLCVSVCPEKAVRFEEYPDGQVPPDDFNETQEKMLKDRGIE